MSEDSKIEVAKELIEEDADLHFSQILLLFVNAKEDQREKIKTLFGIDQNTLAIWSFGIFSTPDGERIPVKAIRKTVIKYIKKELGMEEEGEQTGKN